MSHEETEIADTRYIIKASLKKPPKNSKTGIVLAHGAIINRQSLIRTTYSFAEYLSTQLNAYVIAPDFNGETKHRDTPTHADYSEIYNITTRYLAETYDLDTVMGFGHSMGCFTISDALKDNPHLDSLVNYGGPVSELDSKRQQGFIEYMTNYLVTFNYGINIENLTKYLFDEETNHYLKETMLRTESYHSESYDFYLQPSVFKDIQTTITNYTENIKQWNKPTLFLFGENDKVTRRTRRHYPDNYVEDNIRFRFIPDATHITPCTQTPEELSKLDPAIQFYRETQDLKPRPQIPVPPGKTQ